MYKTIIHTADWHLEPDKNHLRFLETQEIFLKSIEAELIKRNLKSSEVIICITGDLFDNKQKKQTNEAVDIMANTLCKISSKYFTIVTIGNHDYDVNNPSSMDCITPIVNMMNALGNDNIVFLKKSIHYELENLTFFNFSNFDKNASPDIENIKRISPNERYIGLFHDVVIGAENHQDFDISRLTDDSFDPMNFKGCDMVLMGDVHRHQDIINNLGIKLTYCGSLCQLNFGENINGHGYCLWSIDNCTYDFVELESNWAYYHFQMNDFDDIKNDKLILLNK